MNDSSLVSLAEQHPEKHYVRWLLWASLVLLVIGLFAPIMTLKKFLFLSNEISIYTGLIGLFDDRHYGLFFIILIFSVCFPVAKIFALTFAWHGQFAVKEKRLTLLRRIEALGRWSMLDVFILALLVVTIKLGILAEVEVHAGVYFFAASVLASMAASLFMNRLARL